MEGHTGSGPRGVLALKPSSVHPWERRGCSVQSPETVSWLLWVGRGGTSQPHPPPTFLLRKICFSRPPGCCYINISAASRRLLSPALTPRGVTPGSAKCHAASFLEEAGQGVSSSSWTSCPSWCSQLHPSWPQVPCNRCTKEGGLEQPAHQQANPTLPTSLGLPGKGGFSASLWDFCSPEGSPTREPHAGSLPCVERGCCFAPV